MSELVDELLSKSCFWCKERVKQASEEITKLQAEVDDVRRIFDLQWEADQRAVQRWQQAHPGNDLVWPDRADLVVWLLEQDAVLRSVNRALVDQIETMVDNAGTVATLRAENERLREALETIDHGWENPMDDKGYRALSRFMWETARTAIASTPGEEKKDG